MLTTTYPRRTRLDNHLCQRKYAASGFSSSIIDRIGSGQVFQDPQVSAGPGRQGVVDVVSVYQRSVEGPLGDRGDLLGGADRVVVRWTGKRNPCTAGKMICDA